MSKQATRYRRVTRRSTVRVELTARELSREISDYRKETGR